MNAHASSLMDSWCAFSDSVPEPRCSLIVYFNSVARCSVPFKSCHALFLSTEVASAMIVAQSQPGLMHMLVHMWV